MKVYMTEHSFKRWNYSSRLKVEGTVYAVQDDNNEVYYLACVHEREPRLARPAELKFVKKDFSKWKEISLIKMAIVCQTKLAHILGEAFPYEESYWGTKEKFQAWENPTTLSEKVDRAVNDGSFFRKWRETAEFAGIKSTYPIRRKQFLGKNICYIESEGWFCEEYRFNKYCVLSASLKRIDEDTAKETIRIAAANKR